MFRRCTFWSWWVLQCALLWLGPATCQASRLAWAGRQPNIDLPSPYLTQTNTIRQSTVLQPFLSYSAIRAELQHFNTTFTALPANDKQVFCDCSSAGNECLSPPRYNGESKFCGFGRWAADVVVGGGWFIWFIGQQFPENPLIGRQRDQWQWCQQKHMAPEEDK